MKRLLFTLLGVVILLQESQAQSPIHMPDNIGSGNCLGFDGNDYVRVNDLDPNATTFTYEAWIYISGGSGQREIMAKLNQIEFYITGQSRIGFSTCCGGWNLVGSTALQANTWYHVAGVYDNGNVTVYVNGTIDGVTTGTLPAQNDWDLTIGVYSSLSGAYWVGELDEIRIWNTARSQAQIRNNMCNQLQGNETGLMGYWNMNEGTGNTVSDLTTNANHGTRQ